MRIIGFLFGLVTGVVVFVIAWLVAAPLSGWLQEILLHSDLAALSGRVVSAIADVAG